MTSGPGRTGGRNWKARKLADSLVVREEQVQDWKALSVEEAQEAGSQVR